MTHMVKPKGTSDQNSRQVFIT